MSEHYLKKELYEMLKTDNKIFDFIQAGSLDGIWFLDITNPSEEWLSPEFKKLFGYEDHEVPNTSNWWKENIHPKDLKIALENFEKHLNNPNHAYDQIVRYKHKNGSTIWVRCRGIAIRDENGVAIRMLGAHTDVTKIKESEEALAKKNEELEEFAHIISHDLNEPNRAMKTFANMILTEYSENLDEKAKEYLYYIVSGANKMRKLIEGLLEYSKVSSKLFRKDKIDLSILIGEIEDDLDFIITKSNAKITYSNLPSIYGDKNLIKLVFLNLISNAIKFTNKDKNPKINIYVNSENQICIEDNGIGIREPYLDKIFTIFCRLNSEDDYPGIGLGLAIVKKVIELHSGNIKVNSKFGAGSTFLLSL